MVMTSEIVIRDAIAASSKHALYGAARASRLQRGLIPMLARRHYVLRQHAALTSQSSSRQSRSFAASQKIGFLLNQPSSLSLSPSQARFPSTLPHCHTLPAARQPLLSAFGFHRARRRPTDGIRWKSNATHNKTTKTQSHRDTDAKAGPSKAQDGGFKTAAARSEYGYLLNRLPDISGRFHRPNKYELLAAATGFWSRLGVRFKWFSIRSLRPFNIDDFSAFVTWALAGHLIWILVGTTTFCSLLIFAVNTVFAQETLAGWVGNYLTQSSGVKVVFESAIVPKWKDGVITFTNVFVSRRPGQGKSKVRKGSSPTAAAAMASKEQLESGAEEPEDTNFTQYDLSFETINVTLSFAKWFNGHGLLKDVEVKGVRGVLDRTSVHWPAEYIDPRSFKHEHQTGDFELESFKMEDLLISVHQPGGFRPFSVSIFTADLPQLRKQYLFYDLLSANTMSGSFDDSPFFIHPRQLHNFTGATLPSRPADDATSTPGHWKKQSRVRVDGLKIDHLNRGVEGPFSWIHQGNVDIVADVMFPADDDESITRIVSEFYDKVEQSVTNNRFIHPAADARRRPPPEDGKERRYMVMDLRVHMNDVHATVPLFTRDLSYVNLALVRPIVAYINSQRTFIPINCRVVKEAGEFDGSWTIYDSGLMEDLSRETYDAFARDVVDEQQRMKRIKKVGVWTLQLAVQALFLGLAGAGV